MRSRVGVGRCFHIAPLGQIPLKITLLKSIKQYLAEPGNWGLLSNTQPICVLDRWITAVSEIY